MNQIQCQDPFVDWANVPGRVENLEEFKSRLAVGFVVPRSEMYAVRVQGAAGAVFARSLHRGARWYECSSYLPDEVRRLKKYLRPAGSDNAIRLDKNRMQVLLELGEYAFQRHPINCIDAVA